MLFKSFLPSLPLQPFIKTYQIRHFTFEPGAKIPIKAFPPRPEQYLLFFPRGFETQFNSEGGNSKKLSKPTITGQYTQRINRLVSHDYLLIQVVCKPGALFRLTGIPYYEMRDQSIELDSVFPNEFNTINQQLQDSKSYLEMISYMDIFLLDLFNKKSKEVNLPFDKVIPFLTNWNGSMNIDWLADQACLSVRQFERLSKSYFGISPKTMTRIARFTAAFIMRSRHPEYSWIQIAWECGYEDYQHLVRDYKDFSEVTPNQLLIADQNAPDRVLGLR